MELDLEEEKEEEPKMELDLEEEKEEPKMELDLEEEKEEEPKMDTSNNWWSSMAEGETSKLSTEAHSNQLNWLSLEEIDKKVGQLSDKISTDDESRNMNDKSISNAEEDVEEKPKKKKSFSGIILTWLTLVISLLWGATYVYFNYPTLFSSLSSHSQSAIISPHLNNVNTNREEKKSKSIEWWVSGSTGAVVLSSESDTWNFYNDSKVDPSNEDGSIKDAVVISSTSWVVDEASNDLPSGNTTIVDSDKSSNIELTGSLTGRVLDKDELVTGDIITKNNYVEQSKQLIREVKLLLIKNYRLAKQKNDTQTKLILAKILKKINKLDPQNADEKMINILNKFIGTLQKRLKTYQNDK